MTMIDRARVDPASAEQAVPHRAAWSGQARGDDPPIAPRIGSALAPVATVRAGPLWRRWVVVTTAGEVAGFTAPAVAGAVTTAADVSGLPQAAALVAAGAVEGAVLGWAQARVLRAVVPGLNGRWWIGATAGAAMLAYAAGMLPSLLPPLPLPGMIAVGVFAGAVLLASIGTAQWLVLRRCRPGIAWWIPVTAGAWVLGLAGFFAVATPLWQPGQSIVVIAGIGVLAAVVMAAVVAAVTGWAVVRLTRSEVSDADQWRPSTRAGG
jgi:hypothetical protein